MSKKKRDLFDIYIVPTRTNPIFPGFFTTIEISDKNDIEAVDRTSEKFGFGILKLKEEAQDKDELTPDSFRQVGTFLQVHKRITTIYGSQSLYVASVCKFVVEEIRIDNGLISASVWFTEEEPVDEIREAAYTHLLKQAIHRRADATQLMENTKLNAANIPTSSRLADFLATVILSPSEQQDFLEISTIDEKVKTIFTALKEEINTRKIEQEIMNTVNKRTNDKQREYLLREELKVVKQKLEELGTQVDENNEILDLTKGDLVNSIKNPPKAKLIDRLKALNLTGEVYETVFNEYSKLQSLEAQNPEYSLTKTYLETIADLPWNTFSEENYTIEDAKNILEEDHYGIKEVKDRVLEFLAVRKLKNDTKGSIICLIGPPGTGKTSVGVSIARALNKKYYRFSVGGMKDEAEIKGHRKTYVGAMPGQIIKGLKVTKTKNPVFVIDEIDKMAVSNQGDPASALLEVLDPEQNKDFRDFYLDVPFDISNILFIVTANSTDNIPRPLLDRMECIEMSGYTSEEKLHIGKKYLVPKSRKKHGLKAKDVKYSDKMLKKIAEEYAREAGVRNFEKALDKIHRKIAMEIVSKQVETPIVIDDEKLIHYLGLPIFHEDELIKADRPGISIGLAWTSLGGDVLSIEAQRIPGKGELKLTGQLGDVMKESATIAFSYIKSISEKYEIPTSWFSKNSIHLHVPEGATPKDGPSAGITMATAMFSLITNQTMAPDMAMTGELSLMGKVMPIGGLKEKVLAAKRNMIKTIIIPKHNQRDLDKLDDNVKRGLNFHLVGDMEEVINLAFYSKKT